MHCITELGCGRKVTSMFLTAKPAVSSHICARHTQKKILSPCQQQSKSLYQCKNPTTGLCDQKNGSNSLLTYHNPSSSDYRAYHKELCWDKVSENHKHLLNGTHILYIAIIFALLPCSHGVTGSKARDQILGDRERTLFYSSLSPETFRT